MSANNPHDVYAAERSALVDQLRALTPSQAETVVPACPEWTVKEVVAHLSGLVAETLANVPPPVGSYEATTRQVGDRANLTLAEVCDEWENNAAAYAEHAANNVDFATALMADLTVHIHDIAEGLDIPTDETSTATIESAERYLMRLQERVAERLDVSLNVNFGKAHDDATAPTTTSDDGALTLTASHFDFLRSVTGRRIPAQVAEMDWTGDPSELIANAFFQYGPNA